MKTPTEITESIFQTLANARFSLSKEQKSILKVCMSEWIEHVKKHQDRDTRHACAENINDLEHDCETPNGDDAIRTDTAYETVMNTKAL